MNKFNILPSQKGNLFLETKTHMLYTCDGFVIHTGEQFDTFGDALSVSQNVIIRSTNGFEFNCVEYGIGVKNISFVQSELELYLVKFKETDTKLYFQTLSETIDWFYGQCNDSSEWQVFTPIGTMWDGREYLSYQTWLQMDVFSIYSGDDVGSCWSNNSITELSITFNAISLLKLDKVISQAMVETEPTTGKTLITYRKNEQ